MLMFLGCHGGGGPQGNGNNGDGTDTSGDEGYGFERALLTVNPVINGALLDPLPLIVVSGEDVVVGSTKEPVEVGAGEAYVVVGPEVVQSDWNHSYYPTETDGYTDDGYPLVVHDYMRFVSVPGVVTVDDKNEVASVSMHAAVGEGRYDCTWTEYQLDETDENYCGDDGDSHSYRGGWLALKNGRDIVPSDPLNFMSLMSDGDVVQVDGYGLSLSTHGRNIIVNSWREDMGLNDFGFYYVNFNRERTWQVECRYDWSDWLNTYELPEL